ncbi:MAG TPA: mannitol dehydrogenase family protein [Balneolales bacterium]|nr:mannitol dehydrogenase family protein [Balneolales bacterium]
MRLNKKSIKQEAETWKKAGITLPQFDIDQIAQNTKEKPEWVHFGSGNIFRAFIANLHQNLLNLGKYDTGIIAVESFDFEVMDKMYTPYDDLSLLVLMNTNGKFDKSVIGSIAEGITTDAKRPKDHSRLVEIFENPSLQMVSFTITEKGYALTDESGNYLRVIKKDIENGINNPIHTMSIIASLAYRRYKKGQYPLTFVSMDNCSHNGDKLKNGVITVAEEWQNRGFVEQGFVDYLEDEQKITFPLTMIDKITPRPSETVRDVLVDLGIEDMDPVITSKSSYVAPFVNSEVVEYLVIEDKFTNGRPPLEKSGIIFTDRETVNKVETMKVTTCLNPLHTALAVSGCVLGFESISEEVKDPTMEKFIETIGYKEGLKVVVDPGIISPKAFLDEVVTERFPNPYIPDTPARIATDTSQKVGIRFGETIKKYAKREDLEPANLTAIPLAIAVWCRYLLGIDDNGDPFDISPDPLGDSLQAILKGVSLGDKTSDVSKIISNETIFGVNLYEVGLGEKIESMFYELLAGKGTVRKTLDKYFG